MSGRSLVPGWEGRGLNEFRDRDLHLNRIIRARVVSVDPATGRAVVSFEGLGGARTLTIPVGWMTINPGGTRYAWSRYMPFPGDIMIVGFDTNGEARALGYDTLNYAQLPKLKAEGLLPQWSDLRPGEWDFASSGGAYIRGRVNGTLWLAGQAVDLQLKGAELRADMQTPLFYVQGDAGSLRFGTVKRLVLATDQSESTIKSAAGEVLKELRIEVSRDIGGLDTAPQARFQLGDLIDETTKLEETSTLGSAPGKYKLRLLVFNGLPTSTGLESTRAAWATEVDDKGNWIVEARTAGAGAKFTLKSLAGDLELLFAKLTATASVDAKIAAVGTASFAGTAKTILGGDLGAHPSVLGDVLVSALNTFASAAAAAAAGANDGAAPTTGTAVKAIGTAASGLAAALAGTLSTNVFLDL